MTMRLPPQLSAKYTFRTEWRFSRRPAISDTEGSPLTEQDRTSGKHPATTEFDQIRTLDALIVRKRFPII